MCWQNCKLPSFELLPSIQENPHVSSRQISTMTGISKTSVQRILSRHKYHPYHIQLHQELIDVDFQRRRTFCLWALNKVYEDESFFTKVLFSDEATFHRNGTVNKHNFHYYDTENPHFFVTANSQHRWSLNVWAGILGNHIIGPFFFDSHLTGQSYLNFLQNDINNLLEDIPLAIRRDMWFQHDGAPPHYARQVRLFLNDKYPGRWIGREGPTNWPSRSPDLTKPDFFLWGFIKGIVYQTPATTPEDMRNRIIQACTDITPQMLLRVDENFKRRVRMCLEQNGGHFEHL